MLRLPLTLLLAALVACEARHLRKHRKRNINQCIVADIQAVDVDLNDLSGVWYKVLHKYTPSTGKTSFILKNEAEDDKLVMTEYYTKNGNCEGPVSGEWTKTGPGKLHFKIVHNDNTFEMDTTVVYHYKHPHLETEQLLAIYGCKKVESDGTCSNDNEVGAVLSKNRRPHTYSLFHAAKALETACLNPRTLVRLNTLTSCGDALMEDADKAGDEEETESSEEISESGESAETEPDPCIVDNIEGIELNFDDIPTGQYYMIAAHDGFLTKQGITMMNVEYKGEKDGNKLITYMKLLKHGVCYKGELREWVDPNDSTVYKVRSNVRTPAGPMTLETPMKLVYYKNNVFIGYWCTKIDPLRPGKCKTPRAGIWSSSPHLRIGQITLAFEKLRSICVEPRHMIFMNTHARCENPYDIATHEHTHVEVAEADKCKVSTITGTHHFSMSKLEGVWYVAAGIGVESVHPGLRSAVIKRTRTDDPKVLNTEAYVNLADGSCISMTGTLKLINEDDAVVETDVKGTINGEEKTVKHRTKVLHAGSQLVMVYACPEEKADGTCKAPLVRLDSRTREIRHRDILNVQKHAQKTCIDTESINWFFMHSQCGKQFDPPFSQRHGYLALSHSDTMDIITKFSSPMCKVRDIKGQDVCLAGIAKAGPWYSVAMYDAKWADWAFYGSISKMKYTGNGTSTAVEQAVFDAGDGKTCHPFKSYVFKENATDKNDVIFMGKWEMFGQEYSVHFKWIWTNYRLGVGYWCRRPARDGTCPTDQVSVYIMANHESVDHAEWLLMEQIVRSLCVDPALLKHMTAHEICMIEHAETGNSMYPPRKKCKWDDFTGLPFTPEDAEGVYHTMAFASRTALGYGLKTRTYKMEKEDDDNIKVTMKSTFDGSDSCVEKEVILTKGDAESNEWKTNLEVNGEETPVSIWLGHSVGPFSVLIGCTGQDCDEKTGFIFIDSNYRANDKIAIQDNFEYLQENCIDPDWLTSLDTHSDCGASFDTRSCRVADIQALTEYDDEGFDGIWYLTGHTNERYASMKCKAEAVEDSDNEVKVTCYAKMGETCHGPSEGTFIRSGTKPGIINYTHRANGHSYSQDYKLMFQDASHILMVGCRMLNEDGSCFASRTSVMIWSKHASITTDSLPEELVAKLDASCVHVNNIRYLSETDCGTELS